MCSGNKKIVGVIKWKTENLRPQTHRTNKIADKSTEKSKIVRRGEYCNRSKATRMLKIGGKITQITSL